MIFDGIILILALLAFYRGWQKGLLWAIGSLVAVIVAVLIALKLAHHLADFLFEKNIMTSQYTLLISFVILFAVTIFAFRQLAHFFEKVLDKLFLGWVNNVMGGLLYSFFVVFVASLCLWLINKTELISNNIKKESKTYSYLEPIAPKTIEVASAYVPLCKDLYEKINITLNNTVGQIAK